MLLGLYNEYILSIVLIFYCSLFISRLVERFILEESPYFTLNCVSPKKGFRTIIIALSSFHNFQIHYPLLNIVCVWGDARVCGVCVGCVWRGVGGCVWVSVWVWVWVCDVFPSNKIYERIKINHT